MRLFLWMKPSTKTPMPVRPLQPVHQHAGHTAGSPHESCCSKHAQALTHGRLHRRVNHVRLVHSGYLRTCMHSLRTAECLQVIAHMMPDLPNVGWERDLESFREFFENPAFRSDGLKVPFAAFCQAQLFLPHLQSMQSNLMKQAITMSSLEHLSLHKRAIPSSAHAQSPPPPPPPPLQIEGFCAQCTGVPDTCHPRHRPV